MFAGIPDRRTLVQRLILAELLARRGEGPLARPRWVPRPREQTRPEPMKEQAGEQTEQSR